MRLLVQRAPSVRVQNALLMVRWRINAEYPGGCFA